MMDWYRKDWNPMDWDRMDWDLRMTDQKDGHRKN